MPSMKIAIAATFTAEPLADSLSFWSKKLGWNADLAFAPYNQVFQQLLDPTSLLSTNLEGINVILMRPEDWLRFNSGSTGAGESETYEKLERITRELIDSVRTAAERSAIPYLLCLCPASPKASVDPLLTR